MPIHAKTQLTYFHVRVGASEFWFRYQLPNDSWENKNLTDFLGQCQLLTDIHPEYSYVAEPDA